MQEEDHCHHHSSPLHKHIPFEETIEGKKHYQHHFIKKEGQQGDTTFAKAHLIGKVQHTLLEEDLAEKKNAELQAKSEEIDDSKLDAIPLVRFTSQDDVELVGSKSRKEKKTLYQDTDQKMHIIEEEERKQTIEKEWQEQMKKDKDKEKHLEDEIEKNVPKLVKYTSQDDAVALGPGSRKETHPLYESDDLEKVQEETNSQGRLSIILV